MPKFGTVSKKNLASAHPDLQKLFNIIIKTIDCSVTEGHRGEELQNKYFNEGKSKLRYPEGRHNKKPSNTVDVVPYPVDWDDREQMSYFAGFVKGVAYKMGIPIRWGGDWNNNNDLKDNNFDDLPHFELRSF